MIIELIPISHKKLSPPDLYAPGDPVPLYGQKLKGQKCRVITDRRVITQFGSSLKG